MPYKSKAERKRHQKAYNKGYYQRCRSEIIARVVKNNQRYIKRNRSFVQAYLSEHPCVDCSERDPIVLDFDHVRGKKRFIISDMVKAALSIRLIETEISKCEVRCANCHRRKTHRWRLVKGFNLRTPCSVASAFQAGTLALGQPAV